MWTVLSLPGWLVTELLSLCSFVREMVCVALRVLL